MKKEQMRSDTVGNQKTKYLSGWLVAFSARFQGHHQTRWDITWQYFPQLLVSYTCDKTKQNMRSTIRLGRSDGLA